MHSICRFFQEKFCNRGRITKVFICFQLVHSLSQSGQAIYSLRPSTLAQWQYASQQQNSLLITKKEGSYEIIEHPTLLDCHIYSGPDTMVSGFRMQ